MPDQNQNQDQNQTIAPAPAAPVTDEPTPAIPTPSPDPEPTPESAPADDAPATPDPSAMSEIANKINDAHNILIALSADPDVDQLASAIGLSLCLDRTGKRTTAIYSGTTPNTLEFLKPDDTFESTTDTLQDFVIALDKEKADHLRYKLDGNYVKIYITPYRARISEDDLEFTYGDFNIDLVIALAVSNGTDLDSALREHGRIMHDATVVNITTIAPGKFGEIEWSDPKASSISEMVTRLLYSMGRKITLDKEDATALLTGIIAATDRFSNSKTTPETMQIASRLMASGADQQLISQNLSAELSSELLHLANNEKSDSDDDTSLTVEHNESTPETAPEPAVPESTPEPTTDEPTITTVPELPEEPLAGPTLPPLDLGESILEPAQEKTIAPSPDFTADITSEKNSNKYGQMLEDALAEINGEMPAADSPIVNPAASSAPEVPTNPEINGVPEINYMPLPGDEVLPPPPTPPIEMMNITPIPPEPEITPVPLTTPDLSATTIPPVVAETPLATPSDMPTTQEDLPKVAQPAMQDQVYNPQASNPGAFKIPGM